MINTDENLVRPIIFIGPGRSGSTIISEIILAHESLAWPSNYQEYFPTSDLVNLIRPVFDNRLWRITGEKGQLNQVRFLNELLPRPAEAFPFWEHITRPEIDFSRGFLLGETATVDEARRIRKIFSRLVSWQGKPRLSMKITGPGRIGYLKSLFPDALFVNVVRDPVATVRSLLKVPFWKDLGMYRLWWTGAYSEADLEHFEEIRYDPVAVTAFQLRKILETTEAEARQQEASMMTLRYEDFVEDPQGRVEEICTYLDLDFSARLREKVCQTPILNRNRAHPQRDPGFESTVMACFES